ncbi:MAG: hypothetical protein JWO91_3676 [Acidobacteriaceae bacterium]|jgi:hypothetical protein|nr:hypothetical protein [Acidobacteriaceae bacterium]
MLANKNEKSEKTQDLHSPNREHISQGQPFDEQQRQEKTPHGVAEERGNLV